MSRTTLTFDKVVSKSALFGPELGQYRRERLV